MSLLESPGHSDEVKYLLECGADPALGNWQQHTPLGSAACLFNDTEPLRMLLDVGVNIDSKIGSQGNLGTALCVAGRHG